MIDEAATIEFLRSGVAEFSSDLPKTLHEWSAAHFERNSSTSFNLSVSRRPDWGRYHPALRKLRSLKEFAIVLGSDETISKYKRDLETRFGIADWLYLQPEEMAHSVLLEYLNNCHSLHFDAGLAHTVATSFRESWETGMARIQCVAVLQGAFGDFGPTEIAPGVIIREMTDAEIAEFADWHWQQFHDREILPDGLGQNKIILQSATLVPLLYSDSSIEDATQIFRSCQTTFRLLKIGPIKVDRVFFRKACPGQYVHNLGIRRITPSTYTFQTSYSISFQLLEEFSKLHNLLSRNEISDNLRLCVHRLQLAGERTTPEDLLLDAVIVLETIFGERGDSISYKVAVRCAAFLSTSFEERRQCFSKVREIYNLRSRIVHGQAIGGDRQGKISAVAEEALGLAQKSTKRLLLAGNTPPRIPDGQFFDDLLLS